MSDSAATRHGSRVSEREIYRNAMHKLEVIANGRLTTALSPREARSLLEVVRRHA